MCVGLCVLKETAYPPRKKRRERKPNNQPSKLPPKPIVKLILQAKAKPLTNGTSFLFVMLWRGYSCAFCV